MEFINKNPKTIVVLGIVGGVLVGIGTNNIGLGIALGIVFGASVNSIVRGKKKREENNKD